MRKRLAIYSAGILGLIAAALILSGVEFYRDIALLDRNTGSRKGYREWFFSLRTGEWQQDSALEQFMRSQHPDDFQQRWTSYQGTGHNGFGRAILFSHGRPGPLVTLPIENLNKYCEQTSAAEKKRLYDTFAGDNAAEIQSIVDHILSTEKP